MLRNHLKLHLKRHSEFQKSLWFWKKSETKNNSSSDDFQSEIVFSVDVNLLKEKDGYENIANENNEEYHWNQFGISLNMFQTKTISKDNIGT